VTSHKGAIGVLQVLPSTAQLVSPAVGRELNLYDLFDNVEAGCAYLALLTEREQGDLHAVLAGYHQGPESVATEGFFRITDDYIAEVLASRRTFAAMAREDNLD